MCCCVVLPSSAGISVSLGEVRWAIATLRDLSRTSADRLDPRFPFEISGTVTPELVMAAAQSQ
jgi:hypothetical protein